MDAARRHGTPISYDMNYRESLWRSIGGNAKAREVSSELVRKADVLLGSEEDFSARLGVKIHGASEGAAHLPIARYEEMLREVALAFPNLKLIASTLRTASSASLNTWGAIALYQDRIVLVSPREIEIYDRVGGGDSFASGLLYGLLAGKPIEWALRCGVAHGALAMTTPGDSSMVTLAEVERTMLGGSARIAR
jgi:2-dehydro-3-deoxygluconokinase